MKKKTEKALKDEKLVEVDLDKMMDDMEARRKTLWYKITTPYYAVRRVVVDFPYDVKHAFQKVFRGYSNPEVWGASHTIAKKALPLLIHLRKNLHGHPVTMYDNPEDSYKNDDEACNAAHKKWEETLDEMIFAMKYMIWDNDCNEKYVKDLGVMSHKNIDYKSLDKTWMDLEKVAAERAQKGFELFGKHFFSLWD